MSERGMMGLYESILEEVSREETSSYSEANHSHGRRWSPPAPEAGGYVTVEDLEWEQECLHRERLKILQEEKKRTAETGPSGHCPGRVYLHRGRGWCSGRYG